jgi:cysteine synthase A
MALYQSTREMIGNTPLVKLNHFDLPEGVNLYAKLELMNPAGSVKDRIGKYMLDQAERDGLIRPGGTIVEATAGNTGLGIAFAALNRGYRVIFVVPTKFSQEKQTLMRALGAEIINTPREGGMLGAETKANLLRTAIPGAISLTRAPRAATSFASSLCSCSCAVPRTPMQSPSAIKAPRAASASIPEVRPETTTPPQQAIS